MPSGPIELRELLTAVERAAPADAVRAVAGELARTIDALEVSFLIADYAGGYLARFPDTRRSVDGEATERVLVDGTVQGRVMRTQLVQVDRGPTGTHVCVPVTARGEAIGVLEVLLPAGATTESVGAVATTGHALAYIVITSRRYTDLFEWGQRSVPLGLASEIQRRLLPESFTCEGAQVTVAGWLEPSGAVAGDTFDYSFGRSRLHVSLTDAMGHGLAAALLATVLVSSLRNVRRGGGDLAKQVMRANAMMATQIGSDEFVTGLLLQVDLITGAVSVVNAGHVPFYRLRDGQVEVISFPADPPFGMFEGTVYSIHSLRLHPGDRLLLVTDGMVERNAAQVDLPAALVGTRDLHPRELVQDLAGRVLRVTGNNLDDDATVFCLDWYGSDQPMRRVASGADPSLASPAR
ncbi:PP2C family protein-serine/threonine phosphatase [Frankia sp. AiPa1]|uniref:PP2C family protein-serine/threonine phosphatase n=1 Tax=Frankia sp. AiPa1 TaxID=573492 RepID=UPI00202ADB26|nr:PP2C family protein-serine/threonine phosphatase [Frankia sp. AiPa1]MCL9760215.1 serine/threonine-protein phosphatase [Frankia sp. AiPa1]